MNKFRFFPFIIIIILISTSLLSSVGCKKDSDLRKYQIPEDIDDGIDIGTVEEVNIDRVLMEEAIDDIDDGKYGEIHSLLICKDGKLVVEEYFRGHKYQWDAPDHYADLVDWNRDMLHSIMSDSKSITSACIGIAIDNGFIKSVDQPIFDYLREHKHLSTGGKEKITIENLVTMTSGLDWKEWNAAYNSTENDAIGIWFSDKDPISYILEKDLIYEPGTRFAYSGGDIITLGEILRLATGMDIDRFSEKYLFQELKIDSFTWSDRFPNGVIECAGGLKLTPRSMLKIGITFLNEGIWDGKRIVSERWVEKSAVEYGNNTDIKVPGEDIGKAGYSYTWWTKEFEVSGNLINGFWANGWGGQKIIILPEIDTVIIFTGANYTSKVKNFSILEKYVLKAIK